MRGLFKWLLSVFVSLSMSFSASAGLFKITVNDLGGLTPSQSSAFSDAITYWESYLIGVQSAFNHSIIIDARGDTIDGVGGVLGSAGLTSITQLSDSPFVYANRGLMQFDTADLTRLENRGRLFDVIVHEMASERCGRLTLLLRVANLIMSVVQDVIPESMLWKFIAASL